MLECAVVLHPSYRAWEAVLSRVRLWVERSCLEYFRARALHTSICRTTCARCYWI